MRLHVFLARAGVASRRMCEQLIRQGRVTVNDLVVTSMGYQLDENDRVAFEGHRVFPMSEKHYFAFNKPVRVLCTQHDERGREKAIDFFPAGLSRGLFHVGRLDYMSGGLIFFTNDGEFARIVMHPSAGIEKEYLLETLTDIPERMLVDYRQGISLDGELLRLVSWKLKTKRSVRLVLRQGKNREIRRVCAAYRVLVKRLERIRIGCVRISGIDPGAYRTLTDSEIVWFKNRAADTPKKHIPRM